jgi:radical SAM superfamily enzyme YgiQ (UPF0313 family)
MTESAMGSWLISAKRHSTSISPDRQRVYSFDLEGRPVSWYEYGRLYKRSLASEVHGRRRGDGGRLRWRVPPDEAAERFQEILETVATASLSDLDVACRRRLERILAWSPEALLGERRRFEAAYRPVRILPPDQYLAIVLQATFGCSWNRCTFCSFYQDRPFRARETEEFREHALAVRSLLGRGAELRRGIFLADGNALLLSNRRLRPLIDTAHELFPGRDLFGFVDLLTGERKNGHDWAQLGELGLRRVYIGVETGDDALLAWMNKPGSAETMLEFVTTLKRAGLSVSPILIVGAGGKRFARNHVERSVSLMARLPLEQGDIVYLSPLRLDPESEYAGRSADDRVEPLTDDEGQAQYVELRDRIRRAHPGLKVARYDIREFVY